MNRTWVAALVGMVALASSAAAQPQTLAFSLFSGSGPGVFNFDDFGTIQAVTLDAGGVSVSGPPSSLAQGGTGDSAFFFDVTASGVPFIANSNVGVAVNADFQPVGGVSPGDVTAVAVDDENGFLFFSSRATGQVFRAPLSPDGSVGPATVFLDGLAEPSSLHLTSGSRLLVGQNGSVSAVNPNDASTFTTLIDGLPGQTRGLEEDVAFGTIYVSFDSTDDVLVAPSSGGAASVLLDSSGSVQDILLDEVNDRLILANFAVDGVFDVDGAILSFGLDRSNATLTDAGVVLLTQDGLASPSTQNAYFTGLAFVPVAGGIPGDANNDGAVDLLDLDILGANFGLTSGATVAQGDFNSDGGVDLLDLDILGANFGSTGPAAVAAPEPASWIALTLAAAAGAAARNR